ncbi:uncharacterized protein ACRADG_003587 [Cochliomyia hominivorax]
MVAIFNVEDDYGKNPKTLGDWVKNFRLKKIQMKRKLSSGGNLRVCAILSTALMTAELELRRKQQERFQKWLDFQTKINKNHELQPRNNHNVHPAQEHHEHSPEDERLILISNERSHNEEKSCKQSEEITNLWKCELSELDNFMRSISSSSSNKNTENNYRQHINQTTASAAITVSS